MDMTSGWILGFLLAISGAVEAAVFEQITPLSSTAMRFGYSSEVGCSSVAHANDKVTNNRSTCACAQNMLGRSNASEALWWKGTLGVEQEIISVRIIFRADTMTAPTENNPACQDKHSGCIGWSQMGLCRDKPSYMAVNCTKSCGLCTGTIPTTGCADNDTNCDWMVQNNECARNPPYMFSECSNACNVCTTNFKNKYEQDRSAKLQNIDVYIGNSSQNVHINDTTNITQAVANYHKLNSYTGPPTSGEYVIVRAPSDYHITGDVVVIVKRENSGGVLSLCEVEVYIRNSTNGTMMCLTNTSTEIVLPVQAANMSDSYSGGCSDPSKTYDANLNDKDCECALSAVAEIPSSSRYYWWKGNLHNVSRVRAVHVWARKEKDQCLDTDKACPGFAKIGLCRNESSVMFTKCPFSCGLCTTQYVSDSSCLDENSTCTWWHSQQECDKNPPLMFKYCRQSCNMCDNSTQWRDYVKSRLAVFQNVSVYVGSDPGAIDLATETIPTGVMTSFGTANALPLDENPVVFRVSLEAPVIGDTIILRRPETTGSLSVCEVKVLGEVLG